MRGERQRKPPRDLDPPSLRATTSIPPPPSSAVPRHSSHLLGALLAVGALVATATQVAPHLRARPLMAAKLPKRTTRAAAPVAPKDRADAELDKVGRTFVAGGYLAIPPEQFASDDGRFDLLIHAHGASDLVAQSADYAKLNVVVVAFSLGIGSGIYEEFFGYKPRFQSIIDGAEEAMAKRGLKDAKVRRIALSGFSAGFGGVERMLEQPGAIEKIDAVLLYDGLHASYDEHHQLDWRRIDAIVKFADLAARGDKLLYVTHSDVKVFQYVGTHDTSDALLGQLGITRSPGGEKPASIILPSLGGPAGNKLEHPLQPLSHAEKGGLFVRGYAGDKADDHLAHLHQMATTAMPKLAERWRTVPR